MVKKRILVTGAGGAPSTNFIRSLRDAPEKFYIVGVDANKYNLQRAESDKKYLVPLANHNLYFNILKDIIQDEKIDFIHPQMDPEVYAISNKKDELGVRSLLPDHKTIEICQNKFDSYEKWKNAGLKVPETSLISEKSDLVKAFRDYGSPIWIRDIVSPGGGKGSFKAEDMNIATAWIDYCKGWGNFSAAECLEDKTVTWMSLWKEGELIVAQSRKRLYWEFANRAPSGVTGITGTGITVSDEKLDKIALDSIYAIDKKPNGIFSVDLTYDKKGNPNPTEINIGRFFTTHYFFTKAGLNMPYLMIKSAFGEGIPEIKKKINPLPSGLAWVRGMDIHPVLTTIDEIEKYDIDLQNRIENAKK